MTTLNVIGGGHMATAIVEGALREGVLDAACVSVADPDESCRRRFSALGCAACASAAEFTAADVLLLAVKPQIFVDVAADAATDGLLVSIMAGIDTRAIAEATGAGRIVRVMPNLPCSIGLGAAGICSRGAGDEGVAFARALFETIGIVVEVDEAHMDAVTAVAGSGPAYLFLLAEGMLAGARQAGLPDEAADALVRQTLAGAAGLLIKGDGDPVALREAVTSKGGTTEAALAVLTERCVTEAIADAVVAARDRGRDLGS